jgi:hypothetical protein
MSVNVDTVYQRVLAILNKEQRGFLTPQEFNLFANQAQMDLFEQYFYDVNQFGRIHGNDTEYSDMLNILNEKINLFATTASLAYSVDHFPRPADMYRLGTIIYNNTEAERVNKNEYLYIKASPIAAPGDAFPIFTEYNEGYNVFGNNEITTGVTCQYIKTPTDAEWVGTNVNGVPAYNAAASTNFELHESEETELVVKILQLAGVLVREMALYQVGTQEEAKNTQQEKA